MFRKLMSCVMLLAVPVSVLAADTNAAMLFTNGTTWLNGADVPKSSAIFSGDIIQTRADSVASINAPGSSVIVFADSLIQFQGNSLKLEHGSLTVATSRGMAARAGAVSVTPASNAWTEFHVKDVDGEVQIAASKGDVLIADESGTSTLPEGQRTTRGGSARPPGRGKKRGGGAVPPANGPLLNSRTVIITGVGGVGVLTVWVLMQGDDPLSPDQPK